MALKNRLGKGVFTYEGNTIKLQSALSKLEELSKETGVDGLEFIQHASSPKDLTTIFYHLQYGSEYSKDEIHAAFFGRVQDFESEEWQDQFTGCIADLLGADKAALVKAAKEERNKAKDEDTQKKTSD
jgi:hypothetical protein